MSGAAPDDRATGSRPRAGLAVLGLFGALAAWLWPIGVGGRMPVGGDVTRFSIGLMAELGRAYRGLRIPLWNDLWGYGFPGLAESQMGFYYPPHVVLYGLLPLEAAYTASLVLHTFWGALGAYWAARRFGAGAIGAALAGFAGVMVVVWPGLSGAGGFHSLVMLAASPLFAASFLITKALTRRDTPQVIVTWQSITVALFSLPFALPHWAWPSPAQWGWFALAGVLGTAGHICLTRAFAMAEMSATQPIRFLELVWAALLGFVVFGDVPGRSTLLGGLVIFAATTWIARWEARREARRQ